MKCFNDISDYYDLPTEEETAEMQKLIGRDWETEDLQGMCCEYCSHHFLKGTAYMMYHGEYPPTHEREFIFWKYNPRRG